MSVKDMKFNEAKKFIDSIDLLIVTATNVETSAVHEIFKPLPDENSLVCCHYHDTYTIGTLGCYGAVHVQCNSMGSASRQGSALTTYEAIEQWKPKAVVMVGIAFGKDPEKQKMNDILVSEAIIPYEFERISEFEIINRAYPVVAGNILLERSMALQRSLGTSGRIHHGKILSGEKLIDNKKFKNDLFDKHKEAIGGEMEGTGLSAACSRKKITEWLLVKGICDWGDGTKAKEYQRSAAEAAVLYLCKLFSNENAFETLGFSPINLNIEYQIESESDLEKNEFFNEFNKNLWSGETELRKQIIYLIKELGKNAFAHGRAEGLSIEYIKNGILLSYDGEGFDLKKFYETNEGILEGGGSYTLKYLLNNYFDKIKYQYSFVENKNQIRLIDTSGVEMDFIIDKNCKVEITPGEYTGFERDLFLKREMSVPSNCNIITVDLYDQSSLFMMSHRTEIIKEILERTPEIISLEVLVEDTGFIREYFERYKSNSRVTTKYISEYRN